MKGGISHNLCHVPLGALSRVRNLGSNKNESRPAWAPHNPMFALLRAHAFILLLLWTLVMASRDSRLRELESSDSLIEAFLELELESIGPSQTEVEEIATVHLPKVTLPRLEELANDSKLKVIAEIHGVIKKIPARIHEGRWARVKPWTSYLLDLPYQDSEVFATLVSKGLTISFLKSIWKQIRTLDPKDFRSIDYEYLVAAGFSDVIFELYLVRKPALHPISLIRLLDFTKQYQEESFVAAVADIVDTLTVLQIKHHDSRSVSREVCTGYRSFTPLCRSPYMTLIFAHADMESYFDYSIMGLETTDIGQLEESLTTTLTEMTGLREKYLGKLKLEIEVRRVGKPPRPYIMLE